VVAVAQVSRHPVIVKVSADQDYPSIVESLQGVAEAVSINSVPWKTVFPSSVTPLSALEKKVGGGGGGVSGKPAQLHNWNVIEVLAAQRSLPVIASSVMEFEDMRKVRNLGASAISFGAIHLATIGKPWTLFTNPCKPTKFVQKERKLRE
jgi:dihydroorotate dehydrogenase